MINFEKCLEILTKVAQQNEEKIAKWFTQRHVPKVKKIPQMRKVPKIKIVKKIPKLPKAPKIKLW